MKQEQWTAVDRYITDLFVPRDAVLDGALESSTAAGLPPINVAPNQGKLLLLLALALGARTILEIGTLGGYSTIWLARAARRRPSDHAGDRSGARRSRPREHRARRSGPRRGAAPRAGARYVAAAGCGGLRPV